METKMGKIHKIAKIHSSYPTYEEWKHSQKDKNYPVLIHVLILPMRNGN